MTQSISHESLIACATYAQRVQDHTAGRGPPPSGPPPPDYEEYIRLMSGRPASNTVNDQPAFQPFPQYPYPAFPHSFPPAPQNISMPTESFNALLGSQTRSLEITASVRGPGHKSQRFGTPYRPPRQHRGTRGRGMSRGARARKQTSIPAAGTILKIVQRMYRSLWTTMVPRVGRKSSRHTTLEPPPMPVPLSTGRTRCPTSLAICRGPPPGRLPRLVQWPRLAAIGPCP